MELDISLELVVKSGIVEEMKLTIIARLEVAIELKNIFLNMVHNLNCKGSGIKKIEQNMKCK